MKKLIKIIAGIVVVAIVLIGGLIAFVALTFDPNDYKQEVVDAVKEQTGRDLTIDGDIGLTFFPWLGVTTGGVALSNAAGFTPDIFARTESVSVRVKLMPLLSSSVEMDTVSVQGLTLNLARDKDGNINWDDLAQGGAEPSSDTAEGGELGAIAIGGLDIRDANISWSDAQAGQAITISNFNAKTGPLTPGKAVDLSVELDLAGGPDNLAGHVALSGELNMDPDSGEVAVRGLKLEANLTGDALPGGEAQIAIGVDVAANLNQKTASLENLKISALGLEANGNLAVKNFDTDQQISGQLSVKQFDAKSMLKQLAGTEIDTADPKALTAVALETTIGGNAQALDLNPLKVVLDDSTLTGNLSVGSAIRFDLGLDSIDADRYLPPAAEGEAATPGAAAGGAGELPMEPLRALDVDGQLKIGKLKIMKLSATDIAITVKAKDGVINISPISAKLYDGTYAGSIGLNASGNQPKLSVNEKLSGIQAGPLLTDLQGEDRLTGTGDIEAKMTAVGMDADAMKKTLNGTAAFAFTDGAISGINLAETIRNAKAKVLGGSASSAEGPKKTDFSALTGSFLVKNGLVTNDDLSAKSPLLRIEGKGNADLPKENIDYRATATIVATTEGQGGEGLEDLVGIPIPVKIGGTFSEPSYGLDFEALAGALLKSKVGDLVEGGAEGLVEGVSGGAEGLVEGVTDGAGGAVEKAGDLLKDTGEGAGGLLEGLLGND